MNTPLLNPQADAPDKTPARAFTLIELLTVVAILAIVSAILFPVFAQARGKARQPDCLSNLHQIGIAAAQYSQDHNNMAMPAEMRPDGKPITWAQIMLPYVKNPEVQTCPDSWDREKVSDWLADPAPKGYVEAAHLDYIVNVRAGYCQYYTLSLAQVKSPAELVYACDGGAQPASAPKNGSYLTTTSPYKPTAYMLEDMAGLPNWPQSAEFVASDNPEWAAPLLRHSGLTNTLFFDGHAKATRADKWYHPNALWLSPEHSGS